MNRCENKILEQFYQKPMKEFGVRELSKQIKLDTKTIMKYLKELTRKKIIKKHHKKGTFPHFEANRLSKTYKITKSNTIMNEIAQTGLFDELERKTKPKAITIFGSIQKGTYTQNSDIDIFIQAKEQKINLTKYEKKLKRNIQIIFEENLNNLPEGLKNNIISGNTISGALQT